MEINILYTLESKYYIRKGKMRMIPVMLNHVLFYFNFTDCMILKKVI